MAIRVRAYAAGTWIFVHWLEVSAYTLHMTRHRRVTLLNCNLVTRQLPADRHFGAAVKPTPEERERELTFVLHHSEDKFEPQHPSGLPILLLCQYTVS